MLFDVSQADLILFPLGLGGSYAIPNSVTNIGTSAFYECRGLTSMMLPNSVASIGSEAFEFCYGLTNLDLGGGIRNIGTAAFFYCSGLTSVTIPGSDSNISSYAFYNCSGLTKLDLGSGVSNIDEQAFFGCVNLPRLTIPNSVTNIGSGAFADCIGLANLDLGSGVTYIGTFAFSSCSTLSGIYFQGNSPTPTNDSSVFSGDPAIVYYLSGATGWGSLFDGLPAVPWNPQVQKDASFGVQTNQFGFNIAGSSNLVIVVEACTNLANPVWQVVSTNVLTGGLSYFGDPQWTNYSGRFYCFVSP